jgi:hypothetical protein
MVLVSGRELRQVVEQTRAEVVWETLLVEPQLVGSRVVEQRRVEGLGLRMVRGVGAVVD